MLYFIIRPLVRLTFRIFFSKIYLHHLDRIPMDRPVLIASNHPSAFLEACILATHFPKSLHFLVRGDIFINKFVIWLLRQLHLTPIYRISDGFKNLRANESTFNECNRRLHNKEIIVVYAEGNTKQEKKLRPIQKGLARIAFGALEAHPEMDLCIVPLGVNYTHPNTFRSEVYIEVGTPIELNTFYSAYKSDVNKSIADLTQAVEQAMRPLVIHIEKEEDLHLVEHLFSIQHAKTPKTFWPGVEITGDRFKADKLISDHINTLQETDKKTMVKELDIQIGQIKDKSSLNLLSPLALVGWLLHAAPLLLSHRITKAKVTRIEFFASVLVGITIFMYLLYLGIVLWLSFKLGFNPLYTLILLAASGLVYLYHHHLRQVQKDQSLKQIHTPLLLQSDQG